MELKLAIYLLLKFSENNAYSSSMRINWAWIDTDPELSHNVISNMMNIIHKLYWIQSTSVPKSQPIKFCSPFVENKRKVRQPIHAENYKIESEQLLIK